MVSQTKADRSALIHFAPASTSAVRFVITDSGGNRWNNTTQAGEAHDDLNWSDYLVSARQLGTSMTFALDIPAALPSGAYVAAVFNSVPAVTAENANQQSFGWYEAEGRIVELSET